MIKFRGWKLRSMTVNGSSCPYLLLPFALWLEILSSGDKDRLSLAAFAIPVEGTIIKAPRELIDEQHPQLYKDFNFMDFFLFAFSDPAKHIDSGEQLQAFASLSPPI
ncbi:hypothetical protein Gogos_001437, partial [Gossypium gossypioides]|nr:hypothetical protein [Gossypium gossypioides]